jgi:hypothetical protein
MGHPPFDASKAVLFDLAHGQVHLEDAPLAALVPAEALVKLSGAAGADATSAFGRALGEPMGKRIARRLREAGTDAGGATVETVVDHLSGELGLSGLGLLGVERWGRALILVVDQSPLGTGGDDLLGVIVEAALGSAVGKDVTCVRLGRDGVRARFLVAGKEGAEKVRGWIGGGTSWGDALARLHAETNAARGEA